MSQRLSTRLLAYTCATIIEPHWPPSPVEGETAILEDTLRDAYQALLGNVYGSDPLVRETVDVGDFYRVRPSITHVMEPPIDMTDIEGYVDACRQIIGGSSRLPEAYRRLAEETHDVIHGEVTVAESPGRRWALNFYYWLTRGLPPEHLYAAYASTGVINAGLGLPRLPDTEAGVDAHVHLTGAHLTLHARLLLANPHVARDIAHAVAHAQRVMESYRSGAERRRNERRVYGLISILSMLHAVARIRLYCSITHCRDHGRNGRIFQQLSFHDVVVLLRREARRLPRHASRPYVLDPIAALLGVSSLEAETWLVSTLFSRWDRLDSRARRWGALYLRLSAIIHRALTHQQPYRGLEIFSSYYDRIEARARFLGRGSVGVIVGLFRDTLREALRYYVAGNVAIRAKMSPTKPWTIREAVRVANEAGASLAIYLSFIKTGCRETPYCGNVLRRNSRVYRKALSLLQRYREEGPVTVIGVDIAGREKLVPNWVFKPYLDPLRRMAGRRVYVSVHAGEDYYHLANGLRKIYEALHLLGLHRGDSIGHGLALVMDEGPDSPEPLREFIDDLVFLHLAAERYQIDRRPVIVQVERLAEKLALRLYQGLQAAPTIVVLREAYEALHNPQVLYHILLPRHRAWLPAPLPPPREEPPSHVQQVINAYLYDRRVAQAGTRRVHPLQELSRIQGIQGLIRDLQEALIDDLARTGIVVESCPSSNIAIRHTGEPSSHPIHRLVEKLPTCIGSDDPAALATNIYLDYQIAAATIRNHSKLVEAVRCPYYPHPQQRRHTNRPKR